jgi:hypothetical protein
MPPTPRPQGSKKKTNVELPASGGGGGSNRRILVAMGVAALVVVAAGIGYALLGGGSSSASSGEALKLLESAGCTVTTVKSLPSGDHSVLTPGGTSKKWNTSPPTNGPHYQTPAIWGSYTEPLLAAQVVHNLEHGGIFIQYGPGVPAATVGQLRTFYDAHQNGTLLAPLPSLGSKVALGVWTTTSASSPNSGSAHLAKCSTFDEKAYAAFFKAYQFKGPERFPPSALTPGS